MPEYDFDLFVIGAGSGGLACAKRAAAYGATVAICEGDKVGGTCVIRGCVPKKMMVNAALIKNSLDISKDYGFSYSNLTQNFKAFVEKRDAEIARLNEVHKRLLKEAKVTLIEGYGSFEGAHKVAVEGKIYTAKHILIATGGKATKPDVENNHLGITSDELWHIKELPKRMAVIGSGYIGVEFASVFNALGTTVDLIARKGVPLSNFDTDIMNTLKEQLEEKGVNIIKGTPTALSGTVENVNIHLQGKTLENTYDLVLFATGRDPKTEQLNLENTQIKTDTLGAIIVNDHFETDEPNVYALGDVINRANLTPVAIRDGRYLAENLFNSQKLEAAYTPIATAVFSIPEVGTCGLTEQQAIKAYGKDNIKNYTTKFRPMLYALGDCTEKFFAKMIVHKETDKVLGIHIVGKDAAEMIQGFSVALTMGATKADFDNTIALHPSSAEELVTLR